MARIERCPVILESLSAIFSSCSEPDR
jgi:hypothetical protein